MRVLLPKGSLCRLQFDDRTITLSEHGRGEFAIKPTELKTSFRLANGRMRKYTLGWKNQFSLTWNMLPGEDENTFDSFAGRNTLVDALNSNLGTAILSVKVHEDVGSQFSDAYTVFVESYSETLVRRWATDQFWQCSLELVEQ